MTVVVTVVIIQVVTVVIEEVIWVFRYLGIRKDQLSGYLGI
jgi:hypothetical protein